jgi:hypothetical protein
MIFAMAICRGFFLAYSIADIPTENSILFFQSTGKYSQFENYKIKILNNINKF